MLADHLPADIALVVATESMQTQLLSEDEEACVANAVEKRKREFYREKRVFHETLLILSFFSSGKYGKVCA